MRKPQLRSTFARATVPVAAGIAVLALIGLGLWGVAALISGSGEQTSSHFASDYQDLGRTETFARSIAENGPIVLPDLVGDDLHIVLDHTGADPQHGWAVYAAYPADRDPSCAITQVKRTRQFTDCDGRTLEVADLALPPVGVRPIVGDDHHLSLDLRADAPTTAEAGTSTT